MGTDKQRWKFPAAQDHASGCLSVRQLYLEVSGTCLPTKRMKITQALSKGHQSSVDIERGVPAWLPGAVETPTPYLFRRPN